MSVVTALALLVQLGTQLSELARLISTAQSEGRDITEEELNTLVGKDDAARKRLQDLIDAIPDL